MAAHTLLVWILIGVVAGWLAGLIVKGRGFGLLGDILIGIIGAVVGGWLSARLGIHIGAGLVSSVITATAGAVIVTLVLRLFRA